MLILNVLKEKLKNGERLNFVFLGDSVTHGYFESGSDMHDSKNYEAVYHSRLKHSLEEIYPKACLEFINAGIGGDIASGAILRLDEDVIDKNPDLCVVCFGLNDVDRCKTSAEFAENLAVIFDKLKSADIKIIFMTPNMLNTYVADDTSESVREYAKITAFYQTSGKMDEYMKAAIICAENRGIPVCDCYAKWKEMYNSGTDTTMLLANRINHPTRDMHELFANELLTIIQKGDL